MTADVAVIAASSAVMFLYGPAFYAVARLRKRRDRRQLASTPQPRAHVEWSRIQAAVATGPRRHRSRGRGRHAAVRPAGVRADREG